MADNEDRMSPKEYSDFIKQVDLESIYYNNFYVKSSRKRVGETMNLDVKFETSFEIDTGNNSRAVVKIKYRLTGYKEKKSEYAIQVVSEIEGVLNSEKPFSEDFLKIYTDINLNHNTWPYFRTLVQDATNKTGLPPLTLPFFLSK